MDTILWDEESNAYTNRAINFYGKDGLYAHEKRWADYFESTLNRFISTPKSFCDIGCGYGAVVYTILEKYKNAFVIGIDPGKESIQIAKKNINSDKVRLEVGHSHSLPIDDCSIDVVVLRMVMQWVPRNQILTTVSEIDRVLNPDGIIWLQEYLPNRALQSKSIHNNNVFIFKENYSKYFLSCPWYQEVFRQVDDIDKGEDQQRHISLIQKYSIEDVYLLKEGATERKV